MTEYVRELSAGEIIRGAADIYRRNFATMFLSTVILLGPLSLLSSFLVRFPMIWIIFLIVSLLLVFIVYSALTVSVSDACTGSKPYLVRSYKQVPRNFLSLTTASTLQLVTWLGGTVLLIVPGLLFALWFMFAPVVVILERVGGVAALKRSKTLGKGFYGRNFGILCFFALLIYGFPVLIAIIFSVVSMLVFGLEPSTTLEVINAIEIALLMCLLYPLFFTSMVLMYYDMRARKESYDSTALTEDLRR